MAITMSASVPSLIAETTPENKPLLGGVAGSTYLAPPDMPAHLRLGEKKCNDGSPRSCGSLPAGETHQHRDALIRERTRCSRRPAVRGRSVSFIHFGGGTPSTLTTSQVRSLGIGLRSALAWDIVDEVTFECAPRSVRRDFLKSRHEPGASCLRPGVPGFDSVRRTLNCRLGPRSTR